MASITPGGITVDETLSEAEIRPEGAEAFLMGSVRVRGTLAEVSEKYIFRGVVSGTYTYPCDRCLEPADAPFRAEVVWFFSPGPPARPAGDRAEEDAERLVVVFEGNEIDLAPQVWEEAVLAAPSKFLCRPDCAGLCPQCGANLNRGTCVCRPNDSIANKGLAGLSALFPEIKPNTSKEDPRAGTQT